MWFRCNHVYLQIYHNLLQTARPSTEEWNRTVNIQKREREERLFKHSWILYQKKDSQVGKIRKESVGKESVVVPYWKAFPMEMWSEEKSFPAKIFLYFTVYNHCEMSVEGENVYFPRSTFPHMEEIFLPHALGEKIIRIFMAFLTPSSSPGLPQRKTGDLSNWHI